MTLRNPFRRREEEVLQTQGGGRAGPGVVKFLFLWVS